MRLAPLVFVACGGLTDHAESGAPDASDATHDAIAFDEGIDVRPGDAGSIACDPKKPFGAPQLVSELSTGGAGGAKLSPDELTVFFASTRNGPVDLFEATRPNLAAPFGTPSVIPFVSGGPPRVYPTLTSDQLTIVYAQTSAMSATLEIATRTTTSMPFSAPKPVFGDSFEFFPHLLPDGSALYFSYYASMSASHIVRSAKSGSSYQPAVPVPGLDPGSWADIGPAPTPDELAIYFSSTRQGDPDIWMAHRASKSDPFGPAVRVAEISSPAIDIPTWISPDECEIWIMTGFGPPQDGGPGMPVIARATRPK